MTSPVPLLLPLASSDSIYPSPSVPLPSLAPSHTTPNSTAAPSSSLSSSSSSAASSAGSSFDCGVAPHSRLTFSQSMEPSGPVTVSTDRETIVLDVLQLQSCDNVKLISQLKGYINQKSTKFFQNLHYCGKVWGSERFYLFYFTFRIFINEYFYSGRMH